MRILRNLRIDEVSAVIKGANPDARVLIRKSDDDAPLLFNDIMAKRENDDISDNIDDAGSAPLLEKLDQFITVMSAADPSKSPQEHLFSILHSARGRRLAEHLNSISKNQKDKPPMLDIAKIVSITEEALMASVTKRDGESYHQSFARRYENDISFRNQWAALTEAKHLLSMASTTKSMATLTPTSTEVGSSATSDDSAEAVRQLQEMAEKNGRSFESVFADPANRALAARTYTAHHR